MKSVVPELEELGRLSGAVWSPDKTHLAIAGRLHSREVQRSVYRLFLLSEDGANVRLFPEAAYPDPGGIYPLFWNTEGIYARCNRGLLRCDPVREQCELVYALPKDRFAFAGRAVARNEALLLVQDHDEDPYEARGKEIHSVDLATGRGRVFMRAPDGLYVSDLDWIGDSES
jgi:hypothetical protein